MARKQDPADNEQSVTFGDLPSIEATPAVKAGPPPLEPIKRRGRPPGSTSKAKPAPAPDAEPLDKAQVAAAWIGLFFILRVVAGWFGWECNVKQLPAEEAKEDAKTLVLLPGLHKVRFLSWIGAPVVVLQRFSEHFTYVGKKKRQPAAAAGAPAPAPVAESSPAPGAGPGLQVVEAPPVSGTIG